MAGFCSKPLHRWGLLVLGLLILTLVSPAIVEPVRRMTQVTLIPDEQADRASGLVRLFRGLQLSMADIFYNRSTIYMHSGIRYDKLQEEDILSEDINAQHQRDTNAAAADTTASAAAEPADDHEHEDEHAAHAPSVGDDLMIPPPQEDFRGFIGDIERAVKPFPEIITITTGGQEIVIVNHPEHVKPEEALPWLRLATLLNPEHQQSWVGAAFLLLHQPNADAATRAIALLQQAVRLNPIREGQLFDRHSIYYLLGHTYLVDANDPARALAVLEPAVERGEKDYALLDEVQQDWLLFAFRDAVMSSRRLGLHEKALDLAKRGVALCPDDEPLLQMMKREQETLEKLRQERTTPQR